MHTSDLAEVVGVLHGLWRLDDRGLFDSESRRRTLARMETCLEDWVATAPDWVFPSRTDLVAGEQDELPGQDVLPFGGEG